MMAYDTKHWWESKAIWSAIGLALTAIGGFLTGRTDVIQTITLLLGGLGIAGLRLGNMSIA